MADTLVAGGPSNLTDALGMSPCGPYWSDKDTGALFFSDDTNFNVMVTRTTDAGATWSTPVAISSGTTICLKLAAFYDKEVPGGTGTTVHLAYMDNYTTGAVRYQTYDVAAGSAGTERVVDSSITPPASVIYARVAICKTVSGNIIVAFSTSVDLECYKSSDGFATAGTDIADVYETANQNDWVLLFPANTADGNDACAIFLDRSASAISVKMWDDSAGTWTETAIGSMTVNSTNTVQWIDYDASVRHSDAHILLCHHVQSNTSGDDLKTWDINPNSIASPTVTAKTDVVTNSAGNFQTAVFIDQNNDDVYVVYLRGTFLSAMTVYYRKSTDDMANWGGETTYSEDTADDFRIVHAGRTVTSAGGRFQPCYYDDDDVDIYINLTNDIELGIVQVTLTGAKGAPAGALSQIQYQIALAGARGAPAGDLGLSAFIGLLGSMGAPSGAITTAYLISLAGVKGAPSGQLSLIEYLITLLGTKGAPSGTLSLSAFIGVLGAIGAPSGTIVGLRVVTLEGAMGAPSGALSFIAYITLLGSTGAPSGTIVVVLSKIIEGATGAPSGTLTSIISQLAGWPAHAAARVLQAPGQGFANIIATPIQGVGKTVETPIQGSARTVPTPQQGSAKTTQPPNQGSAKRSYP